MPLEVALSMQAHERRMTRQRALPPSIHPKLGVQSKHKGFRRVCPSKDF